MNEKMNGKEKEIIELEKIIKNLTPYQKQELQRITRSEFAWDKWCHNCQASKIYRTNITSGKKINTINNNLARSSLCYIRDKLAETIETTERFEREEGKTANWIEILNNWQQHGYCFFYFNLADWIVEENKKKK